jgi:hypothetical protein
MACECTCDRDRHLFCPGPKRILALDGGGVRGAITVAFLEQIEAVISEHLKKPVHLGNWFDLVGGTSTGISSPRPSREQRMIAATPIVLEATAKVLDDAGELPDGDVEDCPPDAPA